MCVSLARLRLQGVFIPSGLPCAFIFGCGIGLVGPKFPPWVFVLIQVCTKYACF